MKKILATTLLLSVICLGAALATHATTKTLAQTAVGKYDVTTPIGRADLTAAIVDAGMPVSASSNFGAAHGVE